MACLSKKVWDNTMLTFNTKIRVYQACVLSRRLNGSESWTLYSHQERRQDVFRMRNLRRLLSIILAKSGYKHKRISPGVHAKPLCYSLPETSAFAWPCVSNGRLSHSKGLPVRRARLRFMSYRTTYPALQSKDVCKKDLKTCGI
ncbi:hypothetical protein ElyMa_002499700 [Elysia marginata]|uniref:Uncharacterized protein n=1 Tax=Elysia marginata TaxID=1093978 RepID=A0AAV4GQV3_9GAST|nr:hypothetical protein ElyMa_002499700 [Elysia marginata]